MHTPPQHRKREITDLIAAITPILKEHIDTLSVRRIQLVRKDHYGRVIREEWNTELDYFILHFIYAGKQSDFNLAKSYADSCSGTVYERILKIIDVAAEKWTQNKSALSWIDINPREFEIACCNELKKAGWDANATRASWDQGIDVIAKSNGLKLVVQCKKYESIVGNKAVQEIIAGREFEKANFAAVVSLTDFTKSAYQLATSANVILLHPDRILSLLDVNRFDPNANYSALDAVSSPQDITELLNSFIEPLCQAEESAQTLRSKRESNSDEFSDEEDEPDGSTSSDEVLVQKAIDIIQATGRATIPTLQRRLFIGNDRASAIMGILEKQGIVGPDKGGSPRDILVDLHDM
jgi:restriction system protein